MFCGLQGRKAEEQRAQRLSAELGNFRHEAEKRLAEKDEEIDAIRWVNHFTLSVIETWHVSAKFVPPNVIPYIESQDQG